MRGKGKRGKNNGNSCRITPAYAGKRAIWKSPSSPRKDHPRLCGEKSTIKLYHTFVLGSPPPMRGKAESDVPSALSCGITPAYAGKRGNFPTIARTDKDHPRLCGEKSLEPYQRAACSGSPPPMRGKVTGGAYNFKKYGITPAYAGKSSDYKAGKCWFWDHPRLCGEKQIRPLWRTWRKGSPPPMRGKADSPIMANVAKGITPAYAGKSVSNSWNYTILLGSPPPMRGKANVPGDKLRGTRITPAYAGKRVKAKNLLGFHRDHPRLCGEKATCKGLTITYIGSPPPMRGKAAHR